MVLCNKTSYAVRCDLCHNATHTWYQIQFDEDSPSYKFCSPVHYTIAQENYFKNKKTPPVAKEEERRTDNPLQSVEES